MILVIKFKKIIILNNYFYYYLKDLISKKLNFPAFKAKCREYKPGTKQAVKANPLHSVVWAEQKLSQHARNSPKNSTHKHQKHAEYWFLHTF